MAIVHMKKLRLMVVRRQKDELLRDLMLLGCVQISEPDALLADAESAAVLRQESGNVTEVRSELTRLTAALKLLDKYAPVKSRLLSSRPEVTEADFLDDGAYRQELDAVAQLEELEAAVRRYNGEEAKLRSNMEALRPWQTLDLPLDLGETVRTRISLGMLPAAVDLAETAKALADAAPESQLYEISSDKEQHYVLLICLKEELTEAITALRASGFTLANLNGAPGTAKQNIEDAQQQIADVTRRREQAETDIAAFAPHRDAFKLCIDRASVKLGRAEAEERLVGTESVVCMRGWLTAPEEAKLTAVLAKYDCAWDLADPTEDEYPEVPVKLQNNKFTEPLNMVTNMYSLPAYGTVDPNPLMAPFFILFYGIMMADMGYGLVMMIAALVALGKMKPKRGSKYFCELLFACGVSTFLLGIVTGGFFGNAVPTIVKMFGHDVKLGILTSPLLDPLTDTTQILIGAMVLGFIQLSTGMVVNMVMECRQGKVGDAIFNEGTWFVIFAGLALFVLKIGNIGGVPVVLCIGVLMLIYGSGREAKGFGKVTAVFGAVYNGLTGWFGDKTKQFTFAISSDAGTVTVKKDGVAVTDVTNFTLSDGETVKVSGIPANTIITVTEKLDDAGYDTTASGFSQAQTTTERIFRYKFVQEGEKFVLKPVDQYGNETGDEVSSTTIVVQNEKKGEIDNGVLLDTLPYILILVVVVGGGVLLFLRKRKNDDDE